ncbi:hypothetical protein ACIA6T_34475 [Streptomyces sp. NPDC051740]|uniref:hypothetical protein n=1 Tax=Streptomyces sp. NPDC051740 TaxID=3365673 RepID=UPI0037A9EDFE
MCPLAFALVPQGPAGGIRRVDGRCVVRSGGFVPLALEIVVFSRLPVCGLLAGAQDGPGEGGCAVRGSVRSTADLLIKAADVLYLDRVPFLLERVCVLGVSMTSIRMLYGRFSGAGLPFSRPSCRPTKQSPPP